MPRALRSSLSVTSLVSSAAILVSKKILNKKPVGKGTGTEICVWRNWHQKWNRNLCERPVDHHRATEVSCDRNFSSSVFQHLQEKSWDQKWNITLSQMWFVYDSNFWGGGPFILTLDEYILVQYQMKSLLKLKEVSFGSKFLLKTSSTAFATDRIEEQWGSQWLNLKFSQLIAPQPFNWGNWNFQ